MSESITVEMIAKAVVKMMMTKDSDWFWEMASKVKPTVEEERVLLSRFLELLEDRSDNELKGMIRGIVIEELPSVLDLYFAE